VAPQSREVAAGFAREDLFTVVLEQFQTDTDRLMADLGSCCRRRRSSSTSTCTNRTGTSTCWPNPAIEPLGEALPNSEIFRRLAAKMGYTEPARSASRTRAGCAGVCAGRADREVRLAAAEAGGLGSGSTCPQRTHRFAEGRFPTPSGKCEFYSEALARLGMIRCCYLTAQRGADVEPGLAARYPLALISPPARNFLNSTFVNVTSLRSTEGEPTLEIHPDDAAAARHRRR